MIFCPVPSGLFRKLWSDDFFPKESRSFGPQLFFYAYRMAINEIAPKERDFLVNEDGSKSMGQLQRREIIFLVNLK